MTFNPFLLTGQSNPFESFAWARNHEPVSMLEHHGVWSVFRYSDCLAVLRDPQIYSSDVIANGPDRFRPSDGTERSARGMLAMDPPSHTRLRLLAAAAFSARRVAGLRPRIRALVRELLSQVPSASDFDVIDRLANPLPVMIISEILGVPHRHREQFRQWSDSLAEAGSRAEVEQTQMALQAYFQGFLNGRPGDLPPSSLIAALRESAGAGEITPDEFTSQCILFLVAGNETTRNLIGNALLALTANPAALKMLRSKPSLLSPAIEEVLRYYSPVKAAVRFTAREAKLGRKVIPAGAPVFVWLTSANRDESIFADADVFDITRRPNRHIAFGAGPHFCIGSHLARLEAQIALEELLGRFGDIRRLEPGPPVMMQSTMSYGVRRLRLSVGPA